MLFLFFVGHAARIFERNYDEMLASIEEELERQAMDSSDLHLQGLPCFEEDEYRARVDTKVAAKRLTHECV